MEHFKELSKRIPKMFIREFFEALEEYMNQDGMFSLDTIDDVKYAKDKVLKEIQK